jgi:two-component system LytT family sensor kinase
MLHGNPGAGASKTHIYQRRWFPAMLMLGCCTLLGLLRAGQDYLSFGPSGPGVTWWQMIVWQLLVFYLWLVLMPVIFWASRRFKPERERWLRNLLAHLICGALVSLFYIGAYTYLTLALDVYPHFQLVGFDRFTHFIGMYFHLELFTYFVIAGAALAINYYQKYRENELQAAELRAQLSQAQLEALRLQLQPHFLFNTLNNIVGLIRNNENREAVRMTTDLSSLLRHVLEHAGRQEVSLREEMELLERYLSIQQMRFSDRLKVELQIDRDTLEAKVPSLILQPIVENALRHGIAAREAGGTVSLSASRSNGSLKINVFNDGPTLPPGWRHARRDGIGLANTEARLDRLYGHAGRLEVYNRDTSGVEATLTIPFMPSTAASPGHGEEDQNIDRR